jgi:hypothetical protein
MAFGDAVVGHAQGAWHLAAVAVAVAVLRLPVP